MAKKYVPDSIFLACDKGCAPCNLKVTSNNFSYIYGLKLATEADKQPDINIPTMQICTVKGKCKVKPQDWQNVKNGVTINGHRLLLEDSMLPCAEGGIIKIYFSLAAAQAACAPVPKKKKSFFSRAGSFVEGKLDKLNNAASHWGQAGKFVQFEIGVGEGLAGGVKSLGEGLIALNDLKDKMVDQAIFHPIQSAKNISSLTKSAYDWASKGDNWSNTYNDVKGGASSAYDWASKGDNWSNAASGAKNWASKQSPRDWGKIYGRAGFEIALAVGTAGTGEAINGAAKTAEAANMIDKTVEAANAADKAANALSEADKAAEAARAADEAARLAEIENAARKAADTQEVIGQVVTEDPIIALGTSQGQWKALKLAGKLKDYKVLDVDIQLDWTSEIDRDYFWENFNKPFVKEAADKGQPFKLIDPPTTEMMYPGGDPTRTPNFFGREVKYLTVDRGYVVKGDYLVPGK